MCWQLSLYQTPTFSWEVLCPGAVNLDRLFPSQEQRRWIWKALLGLLQQLCVLHWIQLSGGGGVGKGAIPAPPTCKGCADRVLLKKALWSRLDNLSGKACTGELKALKVASPSRICQLYCVNIRIVLSVNSKVKIPKTTSELPRLSPLHPPFLRNQMITRKPPVVPWCRESR